MDNVYLTGMMGSGKTVTGKKLATLLEYTFVDLDLNIEEQEGMPITSIFETMGEPYFRDLENRMLLEISKTIPVVVSTGGGIILRPENIQWMQANGKIVYLQTSLDCLWQRVQGKKDRPLLKTPHPQETLKQIFLERKVKYEETCDLKVPTDGKTPEEVARDIMVLLEKTL